MLQQQGIKYVCNMGNNLGRNRRTFDSKASWNEVMEPTRSITESGLSDTRVYSIAEGKM